MPVLLRRWVRLALEIAFGLLNPVLYLAILTPALPDLRSAKGWWLVPLTTSAWILMAAFWALRVFGAVLDPRSRRVRAGIRTLLVAALGCLLLYTFKDAWSLPVTVPAEASPFRLALMILRLCPLYLIPAVLPGFPVEPRHVCAHPGALSEPVGSSEQRLEPPGASRYSGCALSDRLCTLETARRGAEQRLRQPGGPNLPTAVARRVVGWAQMKIAPSHFCTGAVEFISLKIT